MQTIIVGNPLNIQSEIDGSALVGIKDHEIVGIIGSDNQVLQVQNKDNVFDYVKPLNMNLNESGILATTDNQWKIIQTTTPDTYLSYDPTTLSYNFVPISFDKFTINSTGVLFASNNAIKTIEGTSGQVLQVNSNGTQFNLITPENISVDTSTITEGLLQVKNNSFTLTPGYSPHFNTATQLSNLLGYDSVANSFNTFNAVSENKLLTCTTDNSIVWNQLTPELIQMTKPLTTNQSILLATNTAFDFVSGNGLLYSDSTTGYSFKTISMSNTIDGQVLTWSNNEFITLETTANTILTTSSDNKLIMSKLSFEYMKPGTTCLNLVLTDSSNFNTLVPTTADIGKCLSFTGTGYKFVDSKLEFDKDGILVYSNNSVNTVDTNDVNTVLTGNKTFGKLSSSMLQLSTDSCTTIVTTDSNGFNIITGTNNQLLVYTDKPEFKTPLPSMLGINHNGFIVNTQNSFQYVSADIDNTESILVHVPEGYIFKKPSLNYLQSGTTCLSILGSNADSNLCYLSGTGVLINRDSNTPNYEFSQLLPSDLNVITNGFVKSKDNVFEISSSVSSSDLGLSSTGFVKNSNTGLNTVTTITSTDLGLVTTGFVISSDTGLQSRVINPLDLHTGIANSSISFVKSNNTDFYTESTIVATDLGLTKSGIVNTDGSTFSVSKISPGDLDTVSEPGFIYTNGNQFSTKAIDSSDMNLTSPGLVKATTTGLETISTLVPTDLGLNSSGIVKATTTDFTASTITVTDLGLTGSGFIVSKLNSLDLVDTISSTNLGLTSTGFVKNSNTGLDTIATISSTDLGIVTTGFIKSSNTGFEISSTISSTDLGLVNSGFIKSSNTGLNTVTTISSTDLGLVNSGFIKSSNTGLNTVTTISSTDLGLSSTGFVKNSTSGFETSSTLVPTDLGLSLSGFVKSSNTSFEISSTLVSTDLGLTSTGFVKNSNSGLNTVTTISSTDLGLSSTGFVKNSNTGFNSVTTISSTDLGLSSTGFIKSSNTGLNTVTTISSTDLGIVTTGFIKSSNTGFETSSTLVPTDLGLNTNGFVKVNNTNFVTSLPSVTTFSNTASTSVGIAFTSNDYTLFTNVSNSFVNVSLEYYSTSAVQSFPTIDANTSVIYLYNGNTELCKSVVLSSGQHSLCYSGFIENSTEIKLKIQTYGESETNQFDQCYFISLNANTAQI